MTRRASVVSCSTADRPSVQVLCVCVCGGGGGAGEGGGRVVKEGGRGGGTD